MKSMSNPTTVSAALSLRDTKLQEHLKARSDVSAELRNQIVALKSRLLRAEPGSQESKAVRDELAALVSKRASLASNPELDQAQAALSAARRAEQAAVVAAAAVNVRGLSEEALAKKRNELVTQRRALKAELRAVQHELASREAALRVEKLLESLSGDEKAKLQKALTEKK
jgi:hypothetical protein